MPMQGSAERNAAPMLHCAREGARPPPQSHGPEAPLWWHREGYEGRRRQVLAPATPLPWYTVQHFIQSKTF